jgi:ubiquitin C-terminal hydrolase
MFFCYSQVLCIHLKRFRYDSFFSSKIGIQVNFPLEDLDMSPYCTADTPNLKPTHYHLFALISHRGGLNGKREHRNSYSAHIVKLYSAERRRQTRIYPSSPIMSYSLCSFLLFPRSLSCFLV